MTDAPSTTLIGAGAHLVDVQRKERPARRPAATAALGVAIVALAVAAVPGAQAVDEADAPDLRDDVEAVWHEPDVPQPGTQWSGFIRFAQGHNVSDVAYQICKVGIACFAPPTPARSLDARTWMFNTTDYKANGKTIAWGVEDGDPWRVGVQYVITLDNGTQEYFPHGVGFGEPECKELGNVACSETHYVAFDMPGARPAGNDAPAPWPAVVAGLAIAAYVAARRLGRDGPGQGAGRK